MILLALESATDLVGAAVAGRGRPGAGCHRDGRPASRRGPGSGPAAGMPGRPVFAARPSTSSPWMSALGCSPGCGWGWPRPRPWPKGWASGSWASRASTSWPRAATCRRPAGSGPARWWPWSTPAAVRSSPPATASTARPPAWDPADVECRPRRAPIPGPWWTSWPDADVWVGWSWWWATGPPATRRCSIRLPGGAAARPSAAAPPPAALARLARLRLPGWRRASDPVDVLPHYLREADARSTGNSGSPWLRPRRPPGIGPGGGGRRERHLARPGRPCGWPPCAPATSGG